MKMENERERDGGREEMEVDQREKYTRRRSMKS